jgi:hypothetical protein
MELKGKGGGKMTTKEQLLAVSQLKVPNKEIREELLNDWLVLVQILYSPKKIVLNDEVVDFNTEKIYQMTNDDSIFEYWLMVETEAGTSSFHQILDIVVQRTIMDKQVYFEYESIIIDYFEARMKRYGVFGYMRSYQEYLQHNISDIEKRKMVLGETDEPYRKMRDINGKIIADCHSFPGYDLFFEGLCFTSCWRMYFSEEYQKIIPKQLLQEVQQVERVEQVERMIFIELYHDPFQWHEAKNLAFQWLFRNQLGFDYLAWTNGVGRLTDPFTEYAFDGPLIQTVQYENDLFQPVQKNEATRFIVRSFNRQTKEYNERRMKGALNIQAYFPWVDSENKKMMNYRVLYPMLTLDEGISAYSFYIRQLMNLNVSEENFHDYDPILRIYIPEEAFEHFPLDKLKADLSEMRVRKSHAHRKGIHLKIKNDANYLRVVFLSQALMNKNDRPTVVTTKGSD